MVLVVFAFIRKLKFLILGLISNCDSFIVQPILSTPQVTQVIVRQAKRGIKIAMFDAQLLKTAYLSHEKRFREAKLDPYTEDQYRQMVEEKDLERTYEEVDLEAIPGNKLVEIDTIRLLQVKGLIENPFRGSDSSVKNPDIYGYVTDLLIEEVNSFRPVLEEKGFFLVKLEKSSRLEKSILCGFELKNPVSDSNLIANSETLKATNGRSLMKFQKRAYREGFDRKHYCHQVQEDKIRGILNERNIIILNLFGIETGLRSVYLEQLKRGIEDFENGKNRNFKEIDETTFRGRIENYQKFFGRRKVLILDTNLSYFRISNAIKKYVVKTVLPEIFEQNFLNS